MVRTKALKYERDREITKNKTLFIYLNPFYVNGRKPQYFVLCETINPKKYVNKMIYKRHYTLTRGCG